MPTLRRCGGFYILLHGLDRNGYYLATKPNGSWSTLMMKQTALTGSRFDRHNPQDADFDAEAVRVRPQPWPEELLPFTVRLVHDNDDLDKAVQIRHSAYARHVPKFAETLKTAERDDTAMGVTVLLAESKLDGAPLGTMRIQTNRFKALSIEQSIDLPDWLLGRPLAEATRLGVEQGHTGTFVKTVLFKAFFRYCIEAGIDFMVIAARSPLGTMRIQTNQFKPLTLEQSIELPEWMRGRRLAEATRLGVTDGKGGRLVTTVLFKSFLNYCKQVGVEWMVITGRSPIDRQYERMLFVDVFPGAGFIPLSHVGNMPHRVMCSETSTVEARSKAVNHPMFDFMFRTFHPDIQVTERRRTLLPPFNLVTPQPETRDSRYTM